MSKDINNRNQRTKRSIYGVHSGSSLKDSRSNGHNKEAAPPSGHNYVVSSIQIRRPETSTSTAEVATSTSATLQSNTSSTLTSSSIATEAATAAASNYSPRIRSSRGLRRNEATPHAGANGSGNAVRSNKSSTPASSSITTGYTAAASTSTTRPQKLLRRPEELVTSSFSSKRSSNASSPTTTNASPTSISNPPTIDAVLRAYEVETPLKSPKAIPFVSAPDLDLLSDELTSMLLPQGRGFLVVGVVGAEGVGKSTVAALIAGDVTPSSLFGCNGGNKAVPSRSSAALDACVTVERVVVLDAQALLSSTVFEQWNNQTLNNRKRGVNDRGANSSSSRGDETSTNTLSTRERTSVEMLELYSVKLTALLMSICHAVVVVADARDGVGVGRNIRRLLRVAAMVRPNCTVEGVPGTERMAELFFVANRCSRADFGKRTKTAQLAATSSLLDEVERHDSFDTQNALDVASTEGKGASPVPQNRLLLLPDYGVRVGGVDLNTAAAELQRRVRALPRRPLVVPVTPSVVAGLDSTPGTPMSVTAAAASSSSNNAGTAVSRSMFEREWVGYVAQALNHIKKSSLVAEYSAIMRWG